MNIIHQISAVLLVATLSSSNILKSGSTGSTFELLILHNNDMHARFEQTSQLSGTCTVADREAGKCYGGFPRVAHVVKEARKAAASGEGPPVLYLNAGDTYTGTVWFTTYKWKIAAEFLNALQPDAVALGNNEFEKGSPKLSHFLQEINTTILSSNVFLHDNNVKLQKSIIFNINNNQMGIVSFLKVEANMMDSTGIIEYIDEITALKEAVIKLKDAGVNTIIAIGHSDLENVLEIARQVEEIDLVIAGYKNNYFWNGTNAESDSIFDNSDIVITQASGKKVPVVLSFAYNKYLGNINIKFDESGDVTEYSADQILLDNTVLQDQEALQLIQRNKNELSKVTKEVIGSTAVVLDGDSCSSEECNFGNLIADALMYSRALSVQEEGWTDAAVAIIHSGEIAASIAPVNRPASITKNDLLSALPLQTNVVIATVTGEILKEVLENSVIDYSPSYPSGKFLQVSGIRATYDMSKEPGSRLVSAIIRCAGCTIPTYSEIATNQQYKILMPATLASGGYGYSMLMDATIEETGFDEITSVEDYIKLRSPVYPDVADRITLTNLDSFVDTGSSGHLINPQSTTLVATIVNLFAFMYCTFYV